MLFPDLQLCYAVIVGIDGYSRLVTYLHCSDNNCASTVLGLFVEACRKFSILSRIQCDHGIENVDVARWMIETRGFNRRSIISGSSVHNQCIERLWRDLQRAVVRPFANLFYHLNWLGSPQASLRLSHQSARRFL